MAIEDKPNLPDTLPEEESINFKKYLFMIIGNWYWFVASLVIGVTIAYAINRYSNPSYSIATTIMISDQPSAMNGVETLIEDLGIFRRRSKKDVLNEIERLKTYKITYKAISELDFSTTYISVGRRGIAESEMYKSAPFVVTWDSLTPKRSYQHVVINLLSNIEYTVELEGYDAPPTLIKFGQLYTGPVGAFRLELRNPGSFVFNRDASNKFYFFYNDTHVLTNTYRAKTSINLPNERASILIITTTGPIPEKEVDYLNKLTEIFIETELEEKNKIAENTLGFIDRQLNGIRDSLMEAQNSMVAFRINNSAVDLSSQGQRLFEQLSQIQTQKLELMIQQNYFQYMLEQLQKSSARDIVLPPNLNGDQNLAGLLERLNNLYIQLSLMNLSINKTNPAANKILAEIDDVKELIQKAIQGSVAAVQIGLTNLDKQMDGLMAKVNQLPARERDLINLQRRVTLNDELVTFLLQKRAEVGIAKSSNVAGNEVLDEALVQNAYRIAPKTRNNYLFAIIGGLGIPLAIIILLDLLNNKIIDKNDITSRTNIPILGTIGHNYQRSEIPVIENPKSSLSESFRSIRTNLQYLIHSNNCHTIAINSSMPGEGKTFTAVNLGSILGMVGRKTLLMGLDLRKPKIHRVFNLSNEKGISSYLAGMHNLDEIVMETNITNLWVCPSGPIPPNPAELLETERMDQMIKKFQSEYDYIIFDTPPVAVVADALYLSRFTDTNIFVIRQNYSHKNVTTLMNEMRQKGVLKQINIVVNDLDAQSGYSYKYGYNYGYDYGYGYGYGYYYGEYYGEGRRNRSWIAKFIGGNRNGRS